MALPRFKLVRSGGLDLLTLDICPPGGARVVVSTRRGGASFGRGELNLSYGTTDNPEDVAENRTRFRSALGIGSALREAGLRQRHTSNVLLADRDNWAALAERELEGDGLLTALRGRWLSVSIGDCLAIALYDRRTHSLALLHAGWLGTARKIAEAGLAGMAERFRTRPRDVHAVLCPCIRAGAYEVDTPVFERFATSWYGDWERFVLDRRGGRGYLDLVAANRRLLTGAGVPGGNIVDSGLCTHSLPALFFSHRRDGPPSGRMAALAALA